MKIEKRRGKRTPLRDKPTVTSRKLESSLELQIVFDFPKVFHVDVNILHRRLTELVTLPSCLVKQAFGSHNLLISWCLCLTWD